MSLLEINLPEALMDFQVLAVDEGRYNLLSSEWLADRGVLRAVLVAGQKHHCLYVRVNIDDVEWDCSCGDPHCTAIATAVTGFDAVQQRSCNQSTVGSGSTARLFYRLWNKTGQLMAQTLVGSKPNMNLPILEPARGLGKMQPRFVTAADRPILAHLAANAGQVQDQECVEALSRSGRAYWQELTGKALSCGATRSISLSWQLLPNGAQQLAPELPRGFELMARSPLCLLESSSQKPCFDRRPAGSFARELAAPVSLDQIAERWRELDTVDLPTPFIPSEYADTYTDPGVCLRLCHATDYATATLKFNYGSLAITADETADPLVERCGATAVLHARNRDFEAAAIDQRANGSCRAIPLYWLVSCLNTYRN